LFTFLGAMIVATALLIGESFGSEGYADEPHEHLIPPREQSAQVDGMCTTDAHEVIGGAPATDSNLPLDIDDILLMSVPGIQVLISDNDGSAFVMPPQRLRLPGAAPMEFLTVEDANLHLYPYTVAQPALLPAGSELAGIFVSSDRSRVDSFYLVDVEPELRHGVTLSSSLSFMPDNWLGGQIRLSRGYLGLDGIITMRMGSDYIFREVEVNGIPAILYDHGTDMAVLDPCGETDIWYMPTLMWVRDGFLYILYASIPSSLVNLDTLIAIAESVG